MAGVGAGTARSLLRSGFHFGVTPYPPWACSSIVDHWEKVSTTFFARGVIESTMARIDRVLKPLQNVA